MIQVQNIWNEAQQPGEKHRSQDGRWSSTEAWMKTEDKEKLGREKEKTDSRATIMYWKKHLNVWSDMDKEHMKGS